MSNPNVRPFGAVHQPTASPASALPGRVAAEMRVRDAVRHAGALPADLTAFGDRAVAHVTALRDARADAHAHGVDGPEAADVARAVRAALAEIADRVDEAAR